MPRLLNLVRNRRRWQAFRFTQREPTDEGVHCGENMKTLCLLIGCVIALSAVFISHASAQDDKEKATQRFRREASEKWHEYEGLSKGLQGKLKAWTKVTSGEKTSITTWEDTIGQNNNSA